MVSVNNGIVKFSGSKIDLLADLTIIMKSFLDKGVCDKEDLSNAVKLASMSDKELDTKFTEAAVGILEFLESMLEERSESFKKDTSEKKGGTIRLV